MNENSLNEMILSELRDLRTEVMGVRTQDIPEIKIQIAGFHGKMKEMEKQQKWSTRLYTVLGGAIAVIIAKFTGHN